MKQSSPRVSVIQPGARLHYAVPEVFARNGMLYRLHTDLHAEHLPLRLIDKIIPKFARAKAIQRLLGRRLPQSLPSKLVRDHPIETISTEVLGRILPARFRPSPPLGSLLRALESSELNAGDVVYSVIINEDIETMRRMKDRGIKLVHECIIGPDIGLLLIEEHNRFPNLIPPPDTPETFLFLLNLEILEYNKLYDL